MAEATDAEAGEASLRAEVAMHHRAVAGWHAGHTGDDGRRGDLHRRTSRHGAGDVGGGDQNRNLIERLRQAGIVPPRHLADEELGSRHLSLDDAAVDLHVVAQGLDALLHSRFVVAHQHQQIGHDAHSC